jgi:CheY-like chemotaxis protein
MQVKKVLLAEDDLDDQTLFVEFLNHRRDIEIMTVVENGVVLIDVLESIPKDEHLPDLIILDQNMPKRNGLQTLQRLKDMHRYHHIPIAIYSTYTDPHLVKVCSGMGACSVRSKPISQEGYNRMMDDFLKMTVTAEEMLSSDNSRHNGH